MTPFPRRHVPVCAVVRWLSMLGIEPTASGVALTGIATTVEHNLRAGEGTVQRCKEIRGNLLDPSTRGWSLRFW